MMKTRRGRGLLDRVGRFRRFWSVVGTVGVILAAIAMVVVVLVLLLDAIVAAQTPPSMAPAPQTALGLPGINPIIPLGYGILALIVGVVLHELAHGVIARSQNIGVKSLGILWLVIPVGAFVEQDDEEMNKAPRRQRRRVAAAGVLANFVLTVVFFLILAGLVSSSVAPNAVGVGVAAVVPGSPAANASIAPGDIITSVNGTATPTNLALINAFQTTHAGEPVVVTYYSSARGGLVTSTVKLGSRGAFLSNTGNSSNEGFLGIQSTGLTPAQLHQILVSPLSSPAGPVVGGIYWVVLPLPQVGLEPVAGTTLNFYHLTGPLAGMDPGTFWIIANIFYWLAWINLLLGSTNALPLIPLDGGLLFRDFVGGLVARLRPAWDSKRLDAFSGSAAAASSVLVVFLLVWLFVGPRL